MAITQAVGGFALKGGEALAKTGVPWLEVAAGVLAVAGVLLEFLKGGCGDACSAPAELEQIFECAGDDISRAAQLGYLSAPEYSGVMNQILEKGTAAFQKLIPSDPSHGQAGLKGMTKVVQLSLAQTLRMIRKDDGARKPWPSTTAAPKWFLRNSATGWYRSSIDTGNALAVQLINAMVSSRNLSSSSLGGSGIPALVAIGIGAAKIMT